MMSGEHFVIKRAGGRCWVRDLGSSNGTFLNGKRIQDVELVQGAELLAGSTTFSVRFEASARDAASASLAEERMSLAARRARSEANPDTTLEAAPLPQPPVPAQEPRPRRAPAAVALEREPASAAPAVLVARDAAASKPRQPTVQKVLLPGQTPEGQHILSVLVKRTYDIGTGGRCVRAEKDQKLIPGDAHYGDPMNTTVQFESDFVPFKIATDVVLNGRVYSPKGIPTQQMPAALRVGPVTKQIDVIGDRVCRHQGKNTPKFTEPQPFTTMDLRYELAYGGVDIYSDPKVPCIYARNHLGRGFVVQNKKQAVENVPLPNLEDPADRLTPERLCLEKFWEWERQPMPAGFGWFCKYWRPRAMYAGVMPADRMVEQQLRAVYAPAVPPEQRAMYEQTKLPDMDFRFFNGASPGLHAPFLGGDEEVQTLNLTPEGKLSFVLPGDRPRIGLDIGGGSQEPVVALHTVMIRMEDRQVDLVWRGAIPYAGPDSLPDLKKLEIDIQ
jgi:hypothetical protein